MFDVSDIILKAKEGVSQYFSSRLNNTFDFKNIYPIIFVRNHKSSFFNDKCIVGNDLSFQSFLDCLFHNKKSYLIANEDWKNDPTETKINSDLQIILSALSEDSKYACSKKKTVFSIWVCLLFGAMLFLALERANASSFQQAHNVIGKVVFIDIEPIRLIRLKYAAMLLLTNEHRISEIGYMSGFSSHSYFSWCFYEYFKLTPSEYIENYNSQKSKN